MYRDVVFASYSSVTRPRQLPRIGGLKTMVKPELVARDGALDHACRGLGASVGALAGALLAYLVVARRVARGDVGAALGLAHGPVLQHQVPKQPRRAVVSVWSDPLLARACRAGWVRVWTCMVWAGLSVQSYLELVDSSTYRRVSNRRALFDLSVLAVAPGRGVAEEFLRLVAFRRGHVVLLFDWLIMSCAVLVC